MANTSRVRLLLRAVVYQHEGWYIAHCLETDLVAEGKTATAAFTDLMELTETLIQTAMEEGDLQSIFHAAPPEIWRMFSTGKEMHIRKKPRKPVERFEARELALS
jgi:predicted RNase H-like HicB family nuclease